MKILKVKAWTCVLPIRKSYSRAYSDADLHFTADLTNLNLLRQFEVRFYDGSTKARISYKADRSSTSEALPGVTITGDTDGNVLVILDDVTQNSAGIYILTSAGFSTKCNCLYILGTPSKPTLTANRTPPVGENVISTCRSASTTTPNNHSLSLNYAWTVNNIVNPGGIKYSYTSNRNRLIVSTIVKDDANMQFTCSATEDVADGLSSVRSDPFSFDVYYGPDSVSVNVTSPYSLIEGDTLVVDCIADCHPKCIFTWIDVTSGAVINTNDGILYIESVNTFMAGYYKCQVNNTKSSNSKSSEIVSINVKERTLVKLFYIGTNASQSEVIVKENVVIRFTCEVSGDPAVNVKVVFNDKILQEKANTNSLLYILKSASCFDSGDYECEGKNKRQEISRKHISLFVECSPRPLRKSRENITSLIDVPVILSFEALAYPEPGPNGFTWYKEIGTRWTQVLSNEDYKISSSGLETNLTIFSVSNTDYGQYRVTVQNNIGSYNQYIFLLKQKSDTTCQGMPKEESSCGSAMTTAIVLGVVTAILTVYAATITIIWKRDLMKKYQRTKRKKKDTSKEKESNTQKTYVNVAYKLNDQDLQEDLPRSTDNKLEDEDDSNKTQYTDLETFSREKGGSLYDVLKAD